MANNLFITTYGEHINYTYLYKGLVKHEYHKPFCERKIEQQKLNDLSEQRLKDKETYPQSLFEAKWGDKDLNNYVKCDCRIKSDTKLKYNMVKMKKRFIQKALMNFENEKVISFLTLTFRENVEDIDFAFQRIKIYFKQLKRDLEKVGFEKDKLKYCYVWEKQKRGSIHFHIILNVDLHKHKVQPIRLWNRLNPTSSPKGQKLIKVPLSTNKFLILYFSKYFSKQEQSKEVNRRVFLFSKNCAEPVKESKEISLEELIANEKNKETKKELDNLSNEYMESEYKGEWEHLKDIEKKILLLTIFKDRCYVGDIEYKEKVWDAEKREETTIIKKIGLVIYSRRKPTIKDTKPIQ